MEAEKNRGRSILWQHFTFKDVGGGSKRAFCNQCKKSFPYGKESKVADNSALRHHIAKGCCLSGLLDQQNNEQAPVEQSHPYQPKKSRSIVWQHFTIEHVGDGSRRAYCNHCRQSYSYGKHCSTTGLLHHIVKGYCPEFPKQQLSALRGQQNNKQVPMEQQPSALRGQQNNKQVPVERPQPNNEFQLKRRKVFLREHFTIEDVGNGYRRAYCNQCKQSYPYSKGSIVEDTSRLRKHIDKGACRQDWIQSHTDI